MLIKNISLLYGKKLDYIVGTNVRIFKNHIDGISNDLEPSRDEEILDCEGLILIPGFVNSHTHIGDSIGKDVGIESDVESKIHPVRGFKQKILERSDRSQLTSLIQSTCLSMLRHGVTTFVDFREGGLEGVSVLRKALSGIPIRAIILGRINYYQDSRSIRNNPSFPKEKDSDLKNLLRNCDGLGISGPNEYGNSVLKHFSRQRKMRAIHSAETDESNKISKRMTGKTETQRALLSKPDFLVHMTYASKSDLRLVSRNKSSIVVCPRANGALAEGIPDINLMMDSGCNVTLGTDNVMVNSPDMFKELDYLWKVSMGLNKRRISPRAILAMATVNAARMLGNKVGIIQRGYLADCLFLEKHAIDMEPMHNPYAAIVQRASESVIRAVMVGGKVVHGKI